MTRTKNQGTVPKGQSPTPITFQVYELEVVLADITPPILRLLAVDGGITLRQLHHVLQTAFNWESRHLYQFRVGDKVYCDLDSGTISLHASPSFVRINDRNVTLESIACGGDTLTYTYDFGDDWRHVITVVRVTKADGKIKRAILLEGENAGPIEDSGGAFGYMQLLEVLERADGSPEYRSAVNFVREFGMVVPGSCDGRAINAALARLARQPVGGK